MRLSIATVKNYVICHLDDLQGGYIDVTEDYFWEIDPDNKFNMDKEPDLMVGSLVDDIRYLEQLDDKKMEITGAVELQKLANLLCLLSKKSSNIQFD